MLEIIWVSRFTCLEAVSERDQGMAMQLVLLRLSSCIGVVREAASQIQPGWTLSADIAWQQWIAMDNWSLARDDAATLLLPRSGQLALAQAARSRHGVDWCCGWQVHKATQVHWQFAAAGSRWIVPVSCS